RLARFVGGFFQGETASATAGVAGGSGAGVGYELLADGVVGAVDQLDDSDRHAGFRRGGMGGFREYFRRPGMRRIRLGDDGIARGDGGGEVSSGGAVEGERKVVRPENADGSDRTVAGA